MEAIAIGDLHYDGHMCSLVDRFNRVINSSVQSAIEWAKKRGVANVILLGDVCQNPRMSYEAQECFMDLVLNNPDMHFYVILGNHDKISEDSSAGHSLQPIQNLIKRGLIKNVNIYGKPTKTRIDGAPVYFMPWPALKFSKTRLNIAHIEVRGSKMDSGRVVTKSSFPEDDAVSVIGHLHTPHRIRNAHYTGTLYQTRFGERKKKGFHHIQFNSIDDYVMEWIPVEPKYTLVDIVVEGPSDLQRIPDDKHKLVRLIVQDGADVDATMWADKTNVVKFSPFKTKEDLVSVLTEGLDNSSSLKINVREYLKAWLEGRSYDANLTRKVLLTRKRYINGMVRSNK